MGGICARNFSMSFIYGHLHNHPIKSVVIAIATEVIRIVGGRAAITVVMVIGVLVTEVAVIFVALIIVGAIIIVESLYK